jgi:hypothetical protein
MHFVTTWFCLGLESHESFEDNYNMEWWTNPNTTGKYSFSED